MTKKQPCSTCLDLRAAWKRIKGDGCTAVPDLGFTGCCNRHDKEYRTGADESCRKISRARSDYHLLHCILTDRRAPLWRRLLIAPIFYLGVRLLGWKFWHGN
jgi:hypothetical protein